MTRGVLTGTARAFAAAAMLVASYAPWHAAHSGAPRKTPALSKQAMPGVEKPQPGLLQYNGDWAVGCDNLLRCEAIGLQPETGGGADEPVLLQISRTGGPVGETVLRVSGLSQLPPNIALFLNGEEAGRLPGQGDEAVIRGAEALRIVQALGDAVTLELRIAGKKGGRGKTMPTLATLSAAGLPESLRFIDTRQGRTGTQSAFVSRGKGADSAVPVPPAVPVIRQVQSPDADSAPGLTTPEMAGARKLAVCDAMLMAKGAIELFPLDGEAALLLLPCEAGAYNVSAVPLIARGRAGSRILSIARFDFAPGFTGEPGKPPLVVNALWDAKRGILSSLAKGRGSGDCGASENYVWDGASFRLIESRAMHVCRGAWEWIRLWEADPVHEASATMAQTRAAADATPLP
ncbi:MAG TPA: DUF1176 domain-containing protein [Sphingobium sp.]|uniref:DUF1176 domain-containing protein n=1 Tax=Sphingobium sp. TaxID=1912891 RepID=UPI002ED01EE4